MPQIYYAPPLNPPALEDTLRAKSFPPGSQLVSKHQSLATLFISTEKTFILKYTPLCFFSTECDAWEIILSIQHKQLQSTTQTASSSDAKTNMEEPVRGSGIVRLIIPSHHSPTPDSRLGGSPDT